ncbi:group III truncated hemoglobin [Maribacter sp. 2308TA10-17]|uniref:group III truncated hemoglobin n=1 Tax=Maribacter sp. 2308TA10-17 TaxID=3386276 RepID=UPI0039BCC8E1
MLKEIETKEDIELMVDTFYAKVREDALLGEIFNNVIQDNWPEHLGKMYRFWQTVLLHESSYRGNPLAHHINLPISKEHFNRWLELFYITLNENFTGHKAGEAKMRAARIAEIFQARIYQYNQE